MTNSQTRRLITTCGATAITGLILLAPLAWLEIRNNPAITGAYGNSRILLFGLLWLAPPTFILSALPLSAPPSRGRKHFGASCRAVAAHHIFGAYFGVLGIARQ